MAPEMMPFSKFKADCLAILKKVRNTGKPIVVKHKEESLAMVIPSHSKKMEDRCLGSFRSSGKILGDIVSSVCDEDDWEALKS